VTEPPTSRLHIAGTVHAQADTRLVLGHSRHPASDTALHVAVDLARRLRADLHVVHGVDLADYPVDPDAADWEEQARRTLDEQRRRVEAALADFPMRWTYQAGHGNPARLIATVAEEIDAFMIIVGSHGEGLSATFDRLLAGSVSRAVLRRQHRPVLIVPGELPGSGQR
jgi:nucleotide-binding universal stress UspA family protein